MKHEPHQRHRWVHGCTCTHNRAWQKSWCVQPEHPWIAQLTSRVCRYTFTLTHAYSCSSSFSSSARHGIIHFSHSASARKEQLEAEAAKGRYRVSPNFSGRPASAVGLNPWPCPCPGPCIILIQTVLCTLLAYLGSGIWRHNLVTESSFRDQRQIDFWPRIAVF